MELRDISVVECIPRFAYLAFGLLGYLHIRMKKASLNRA
jgi:hypothetical protein